MAGGPATGPFAFNKRAGEHFAEQTEAADEFAAQFQVGLTGCFHMTLTIVSVTHKVKYLPRFARMTSNCDRSENPANKRAALRPHPHLTESLWRDVKTR